MTAAESLLVALYDSCPDPAGAVFTEAQMVAIAYRAFPNVFGLRGYPECPDSKRVAAELYRKGVRAAAWFERLPKVDYHDYHSPGFYRLTPEGLEAARRLSPRRQTA